MKNDFTKMSLTVYTDVKRIKEKAFGKTETGTDRSGDCGP